MSGARPLWNAVCSVLLCSSVRERKVLPEWKNTKHVNRKCQDISQAAPFSFREKAEYATRGGSSTFKNMPFLRQEGRLLRTRKAYSRMQNVTHWFLVGYIFCYRWCYLRVVSVANLAGCKVFLSPCWSVSDREIVCEVVPIGLLAWGVEVFSLTLRNSFSHRRHSFFSWRTFLSLTDLTDLTEPFHQRFDPTERLRHTEFTEAFQLRLAVTFCDIGWLNVSVKLCVFCSSV